ncbi:MAG TPA: PHB depolymerase family esterase [Vicinamibacterales bacterium]|nr:PHB depolymerase family esterase [Vicinamibacterales bacterium]
MSVRRVIIGAVVVLVGLPVLIVLVVLLTVALLNHTNGTIVSSGETREYLLYVPPTYDRDRPTPLVISFHGAAAWPAQQQNMTHWNRLADEFGFIVVYPAGRGRIWRVGHPGPALMGDVRFVADLIDTLTSRYSIDPARVYANGFSLGGAMTFVLSCTLSDRIAAVGTISAAQTLPWSWCTDTRPVPLINFHGTADLVPYGGGPSPDPFNPLTFPPVREWTANWARRNRCAAAAAEVVVTSDVTSLEYRNCANDAAVLLYTIQGGGHAWPGGKPLPRWFFGRTTNSIDATRLTWAFFAAHPLRPPNQRLKLTPRGTLGK